MEATYSLQKLRKGILDKIVAAQEKPILSDKREKVATFTELENKEE
jgi:hypothetical protein